MSEATVSIAVCVFVFIVTLLGIIIYCLVVLIKESRAQSIKTNVLINGIIDIYETKYKMYGEDEDNGGISPGA